MYPNLYYIFKDFFGVEWRFLKIFNSFGCFVALAFVAAAWVLVAELKRKQRQGLLSFTEKKITVGEAPQALDLFINFVMGFLLGYKLLGILLVAGALDNPQDFILSSKGHLGLGLLIGFAAAGYKYYEVNKLKLPKPEERILRIWPHDRVGDLTIYAAVFGFLGAKIFHNLENWNDFIANPFAALFSTSGLTFYGGLICAALAIFYYAQKHKIPFLHLCDAFAPALMLAYAVGRVGCQISGDGDWGILNSAYITDASGNVVAATAQQFSDALQMNHGYYLSKQVGFHSLAEVHHTSFNGIAGLPKWMFAYTYPHNVVSDGIKMINCNGEYCNALPLPVFPTPFYETIVATLCFFVLWMLRNKVKTVGTIFGIYLMLNGFERFWIEKIRVNTVYNIGNFHPTQAEIIATLLFIAGLVIVLMNRKRKTNEPKVV